MRTKVVITYFHYGRDEFLDLIRMAFASAKLFDCETVLVTSSEIGLGQDHTLKVAHPGENVLMPAILDAQKAYIDSPLFDSNSVLFSPDALVARHLRLAFEGDFDMGVTNGSCLGYPINNGVVYIRPETKNRLTHLWNDFIIQCKSYKPELQKWYGDQKAMQDVMVRSNDTPYGLNVKRLISIKYNAAFSKKGWIASDQLAYVNAFVWHFKGNRKDRMAEFWERLQRDTAAIQRA